MTRRLVVIGVLAAALFSACGSSGSSNGASSAEGKKYVDAMMSSKDGDSLRKAISESQARCLATHLIDIIGVDTLKSAGVSPTDFAGNNSNAKLKGKVSKDKANQIADLVLTNKCFDFAAAAIKSSGSSSFSKLSSTQQHCFFSEMVKLPAVRTALIEEFTGGKSNLDSAFGNQSQIFTILGKCKINPNQLNG